MEMVLENPPSSKVRSRRGKNLGKMPIPGKNYIIEDASLLALLQVRPRIPDSILNSGTFLYGKAEPTDEDFQRIQLYFENSKDRNHVRIKSILRITRVGDVEPHPLEHAGPKKMLFHGTRGENIGGILETGFLPMKSRYKGGIYFADRVAWSLQFCGNYGRVGLSKGWLFLCEVLLGKVFQTREWTMDLPKGFNSIERLGKNVPDKEETVTVDDCQWPTGITTKVVVQEEKVTAFEVTEYIVFCQRQARPQYLIEWESIPFYWSKIAKTGDVNKAVAK